MGYTQFARRVLLASVMLGAWRLLAADGLFNPGFESGAGAGITGWSVPSYWQGTLSPAGAPGEARSGQRAARLAATQKAGKWWGRVLGTPLLDVHLGRPQRFSAWALGQGALRLGVIRYRAAKPGEDPYVYLWQTEPVVLGPEWREITFEYTIWEPEFTRTAFCLEVQGENAWARLDDVAVRSQVAEGVSLVASPPHPMLPEGGSAPLQFHLTGAPASGGARLFGFPPTGEVLRQELAFAPDGTATFALPAGAGSSGLWRLVVAHAGSGASADTWADVLPGPEFALFEQAAAGMRLPEGRVHLLVIGDSLSDFDRGRNFADKLGFWLARQGGARCSVRNVGVGGDDITRVWARLNHVPGTYRQASYDGIFEPKPTHIITFLGHNDSKAKSTTDYTVHAVAPELFEETYRKTLAQLKADTGAALIVVSATSSVYEITSATAAKSQAAGKAHNLFGKPEHLERFNALAQRVATESGAQYVDVYGPTRDHPDKATLFSADGVHLSPAGHRFIARQLLGALCH